MDIFSVFNLLGGLAFFLYGMNVMSKGLEKLAGGRMESILKKMTSNRFKSLMLGLGITVAMQSSSALTVMLVGLVNSGIMELSQTIGVLMGSNVGTTLTAWILSLSGISSENIFLKLLKPESFSPVIALIGILLMMTAKKTKYKDLGKILLGFSVLMTGMTAMSEAVSPLKDSPNFASMLTAFNQPIMGVLVGAVFTGIIQSSAASVGILQALALTGQVTYGMAIPIIMGQNIGTCMTAILSSIGVSRNAKRVSVVHICFNCIGTLVLLPVFYLVQAFVEMPWIENSINPAGIALVHTIFNLVTTAMLLPFSKQLEKLAYLIIKPLPEDEAKPTALCLDERLLKTPSVALGVCREAENKMSEFVRESLITAMQMVFEYKEESKKIVLEKEDMADNYEDTINDYLSTLGKHSLSHEEAHISAKLLHAVGNFERISDHAVNIMQSACELHDKKISFSGEALSELKMLCDAITQVTETSFKAFNEDSLENAYHTEPLEEVIDTLCGELKNRHILRLQKQECTVELGYIFQDLLVNLERVSDHCSNIAGSLIEVEEKPDIHQFLNSLPENSDFVKEYEANLKKYHDMLETLN